LGAGVVAGIAQVLLTYVIFGETGPTLGASGALQGLMGAMVALVPTLTVLLFFVVPAPFWAVIALYVVVDVAGAFSPGSRVAHFAHLAGLAVGLLYGLRLKQQGMRVQRGPPRSPPAQRVWR
ncbi:MAG TPA: rhomboid family intramembrane serine protease, partial [Candidatus Thermoplasmatota archaeon]|nr:rhomboid family intramembrane serine protease [Candidatus Thermoplasmatota archaeon]